MIRQDSHRGMQTLTFRKRPYSWATKSAAALEAPNRVLGTLEWIEPKGEDRDHESAGRRHNLNRESLRGR